MTEQVPVSVKFVEEVYLVPMQAASDHFTYRVGKPFVFYVDEREHIIPTDFVTDLASIPRPLWGIVSPMQTQTVRAAVIHDFLYQNPGSYSRSIIDDVFYETLIHDGFAYHRAWIYWVCVRLFGGKHFYRPN